MDSVVEIAETLAKDGECLAQAWFGGLHNAFRAVVALLDDDTELPWAVYDRVVVDEVQDLTAIETSVFIELVHRIGRQRPSHRLPFLLVAGDEGQTVHAAGFEWGALKDLIVLRLGVTPHEAELDANLRSPGRIGRVIDRAGDLYRRIDKQRLIDVNYFCRFRDNYFCRSNAPGFPPLQRSPPTGVGFLSPPEAQEAGAPPSGLR